MPKPKWVKDYFTFNRKERIAAFIVILVISGSLVLPKLISRNSEPLVLKEDSTLLLAIDTLQQHQTSSKHVFERTNQDGAYRYEPSQTKSFTEGELFHFDPNSISATDWQRLGLNERTSKTILKYVSKGGKFYKPEDLLRIWGLSEAFYNRVKNYITIMPVAKTYPAYENKPFAREERKPITVSINEADTSAFIALPGIGSKLSARIVSFRDRLGGFYSIEQIGETWGLPDSTFQKIKARLQISGEVRKLNINTASKDELKTHPYIRWNLANAIVEYRNQHGAFKSLEELRSIVLVDEPTYAKISHYLNL